MESHVTPETIGDRCTCPDCGQSFSVKASLTRHQKQNICKQPKPTRKDQETVNKELEMTRNTLNEILEVVKNISKLPQTLVDPQAPVVYNNNNNSNQNLNILCLGSKDNLLDMLSASEGLPLALSFLKDCALARLAGDCRILQKAYQLETERAAIMYVNKTKNKYVYYDERQRRTVETNAKVMAKKLADILQRSYLKGMECFKTGLSGELNDKQLVIMDSSKAKKPKISAKMPELDAYDLHLWNEHVHELNDDKYQKRLLNSLKIPVEPPRQ